MATKTLTPRGRTSPKPAPADATPAPLALLQRPEFIRLPTKGHCPWSGLCRSALYDLVKQGKIKSVSMRKRGSDKGTRLILLSSLLEYLHSQMEEAGADVRTGSRAA